MEELVLDKNPIEGKDLLRFIEGYHNNALISSAFDTINSFIEDKKHFTLWIYDETTGACFKPSGKITPFLLQEYGCE